jgi:transcriptional regulator with XRE-family HTH domain
MPPQGIEELLPQLRKERGWSRERLSHQAFGIDSEGTSVAQIAAIERGERRASARTMMAIAEALEISPDSFPEYRLAVARIALDERLVGLDEAVKRLDGSSIEPTGVTPGQIREASHRGTAGRGAKSARETRRRLGR